MAEFIEIELQVVDPIFIEMDTSPVYYIGTAQMGPTGKSIELQMNQSMLQWRTVGDTVWFDLLDFFNFLTNTTFEVLDAAGDVGTGADQVAYGNHDHEIGDMILTFNNQII